MPTPRTFEKVLTDPIRPNMSKNVVKKCKKNIFSKTPFWGTSKNRRLDLKVCADSSWLLVFKNGLKKHSSLIIDRVIDVWSRCKKRDWGTEGRGGDQLGFGVLIPWRMDKSMGVPKTTSDSRWRSQYLTGFHIRLSRNSSSVLVPGFAQGLSHPAVRDYSEASLQLTSWPRLQWRLKSTS